MGTKLEGKSPGEIRKPCTRKNWKTSISGRGTKKSEGPEEKKNLAYSKNWLERQCDCSSVVKKERQM